MAGPTIDPFTPAVELAAAVSRREVSPVELVDLFLARVDALDGRLNAVCHRADEEVRAAAALAADAVLAADPGELGPLHGVPVPIKDLFDVAGWPSTYGSLGADPAPRATSHPAVRRLVEAGCVLLGKTTTSEFGAISFTESEALGVTRNPWAPSRTPGGSSGGAGAAVAAGMAPLALGGDGGGSVRVPASCNGLVGLKPTRGRVAGEVVELEGLVTSGVLARSVADAAVSLDVLSAHDPAAWWSPPGPATSFAEAARRDAPPLRVGVLAEAPVDGVRVDPACAAAVRSVLRALEAAGHRVVDAPVVLPPAEELIAAFTSIWNLGGVGFPLADPEAVEPPNRSLRAAARATDSWAYARAVHRTQRLSRAIVEAFVDRFDVLVTPTMACLPPPVGAWREGTDAEPMTALLNCYPMAVFTSVFNVSGLPAVSVPAHHDEATGLPVGVQLVAAPWREALLLQVARALEEAFAWTDRHPVP